MDIDLVSKYKHDFLNSMVIMKSLIRTIGRLGKAVPDDQALLLMQSIDILSSETIKIEELVSELLDSYGS